jgi:hypothetical protein
VRDSVDLGVTVPAKTGKRKHPRVAGPFDGVRVGVLETAVQLFDLSCGGCFVNSVHEQRVGVTFALKIDLARDGWIAVNAKTLYSRPGFGYAVRFIDVPPATMARLDHALRELQSLTPSSG